MHLVQPIKLVRLLKLRVILIMGILIVGMFFTDFTDSEKFKTMVSTDSKLSEVNEFYNFLSDFKNHKPITT